MTVIHKVTVAKAAGGDALEFVMSDATKDRYGDVIDQSGWVLANFKKNPIALFGHNSAFPIGTWSDVRVEAGKLIGKLNLAARGTSDRIDEIVNLVQQGVLRAVSVGFQVIESKLLSDNSGILYTKQELLETSLVSVPANPSAVQIARSMHISDETIALVFGEDAGRSRLIERGLSGEHAGTSHHHGTRKMLTIAKRIENAQATINGLKDQLTDHLNKHTDGLDDAASAVAEDFNAKIAAEQRTLDVLKASEASLGAASEPAREVRSTGAADRRPFAVPAKKVAPIDYIFRSAVVSVLSRVEGKHKHDVLKERYGDDEPTRAVFDMVMRASTAPAMTNVSGWAQELVQTGVADFMDALLPLSVYPGLRDRGGRFSFGRNGIVSLPARSTSSTIAGSFVGQGAPIPVRQGSFGSSTLTPKKMGVITTFTREIAEHSTPSIEAILKQAILEDTAVSLDSILLDNAAATTVRPAGIRNGITGLTATSGGGITALVADLKGLVGALTTATNGHLRAPVWIMNPLQVLSIGLTQNANGLFPFKDEIANGTLLGFPLLQSTTVTATMVMLVDAADFFSATGDDPRFDATDSAVLHMEDTTPLAIGTTGSPNTVAAPARSLWQTDSIAIRMLLDVNWALRRSGVVAWVTGVTW